VLAALAWALFTLAMVWGLAALIGTWQAALAVGAVYAAVAAACAAAARRRWRATELPLDTVKRRWREQNEWLHDNILALPPAEEGARDE
jgi:hypothetical protein